MHLKRLAIISGILLAVLAVALCGYLWALVVTFDDWTGRGIFGDAFGALNAIFSGCALVGVIIAVILQSRELELQRQELKLTREELAKSAEAQQEAAITLNRQTLLAALTTELNALVAVTEDGKWRGVNGAPPNISNLKLRLVPLLDQITEVSQELQKGKD